MMKLHAARIATFAVAAAAVLTLTACGGGGGGGGDSPDPVDLLLDPRVIKLGRIIERSDTLATPGLHLDYSVSIGSADAIENRLSQSASCTGANCDIETEGGGSETTDVQDLIDLSVNVGTTEISLGSRGGFDTIVIASDFDVSGFILDDAATLTPPTATNFGFWGDHGFAAVAIGDGPLAGQTRQTALNVETIVPFTGHLSYALAYAIGDATGSNPLGIGGATWEGIAEAVSLRTFERRPGTVTVIIADLSNPRANVNISVEEFSITPTDWASVLLANGGFSVGTVGNNYLAGNFHGPGHEEAYGVFDTEAYTGAFGAKKSN